MHVLMSLLFLVGTIGVGLALSKFVESGGGGPQLGVFVAILGLALSLLLIDCRIPQDYLFVACAVLLPVLSGVANYVDGRMAEPQPRLLIPLGILAGLLGSGLGLVVPRLSIGALGLQNAAIVVCLATLGLWGALYTTYYVGAALWKALIRPLTRNRQTLCLMA